MNNGLSPRALRVDTFPSMLFTSGGVCDTYVPKAILRNKGIHMAKHPSSIRLAQFFQYLIDDGLEREALEKLFERHGVDQADGVEKLVDEIERDGGDSFVNTFRGGGVPYAEVARDVAKDLGAKITDDIADDEFALEKIAFYHALATYYKTRATDQERHELADAVGEKVVGQDAYSRILKGGIHASLIGLLAKQLGEKAFLSIVKSTMARTLPRVVARQGAGWLGRIFGTAVPVLNVAMVALLISDITSPATRRTIPTVLDIAYLRGAWERDAS